jgi:hypothetical protein
VNDNDLITVLRESFTDVHATTPVEQIARRSRVVRARRRIPHVAGAAGLAGAAALTAIALLPASQPAVHLAAWTVVRHPDGSIYVTINQLLDPAGLQRTLRADGVPASVTFFGRESGSCQRYTNGDEMGRLLGKIFSEPPGETNSAVIRPSAIPRGAGVQISPVINGGQVPAIAVGIVDASPQCTGSRAP